MQLPNGLTVRLLDTTNPEEIAAYEKAVYMAFSSVQDPSQEIIWNIDYPKKRISTKIPYSSQKIIIAEIDGSIIAGFALNFNMQEKLQLEYLGFKIDRSEFGICEGLLLFNTQVSFNNHLILPEIKEPLIRFLKSQNIKKTYGTCNKKRIRGYRFLGFKDIDMKLISGIPEYLLVYEIE